jgi:cell division protein FtsB
VTARRPDPAARRWAAPAASVRVALVGLAAVAILFLFVFPSQSLLAQRNEVRNAEHDVQVLREENAKLEEEAARLQTVSEIERLAREQYHMVYPGEKAFTVVPAPPSASPAPTTP